MFCYVNTTASKVNMMDQNQFLSNQKQTAVEMVYVTPKAKFCT